MSQSHYKVLAKSLGELRVRGDYLEIIIANTILDAAVIPSEGENVVNCVLVDLICSNLWDHVVPNRFDFGGAVLIDSDGFQHSFFALQYDAVVQKAKGLKKGMELPTVADEILGKAKSRGWIAFPMRKRGVIPHRLVFQFYIFDPGCTSGEVRHAETLELIFDLSLYGKLIGESKKNTSDTTI